MNRVHATSLSFSLASELVCKWLKHVMADDEKLVKKDPKQFNQTQKDAEGMCKRMPMHE